MRSHPIGSITRHEWVDTRAVRVDDASAMDAWALRSHCNAVRAIDEGRFDAEIVPIQTAYGLFSVDEYPRRDTSLEKLASLWPLHPETLLI